MKNFRFYNIILITTVLLLGTTLILSSLTTEPYDGDLTRLGGYSERLYGWNKAQETFPKPLFNYAKSWKDYDQYYDIVVIGDSFSKNKSRGWQNFLSNNTGLSIVTFHVERFKISDLVNHPQYIKSPPLVVIYESVERMAILRLSREKNSAQNNTYIAKKKPKAELLKPKGTLTEYLHRPVSAPFMQKINVTSDLISKGFVREVLGLNLFKSTTLPLKSALFSSQESNSLLFLKTHLSKNTLSLNKLKNAVIGAKNIKSRIENNGLTQFYLLVFPNKISVYRDQLKDSDLEIVSFFDYKQHFETVNLIPLYSVLYNAIEDKMVDVYFSDDTHTSAIGYKMAAELVQHQMIQDGLLQRATH